jgi:hypothetical protein
MSTKNTVTQFSVVVLPILLAGFICIALSFYLWNKSHTDVLLVSNLLDLAPIFIGISVLFILTLMGYLYHSVLALKKLKSSAVSVLLSATQKMHNVRRIIEILMSSKMWLPGLREYIDEDFEGLTYFEVKDFYKGNSKIAIEFLQENHNYSETENLYLEMKAMLLTNPKNGKLPKTISYPRSYDGAIVEQWIQHKVGSGLWYFFGYKFASFKEALDIESLLERNQDKVMSLAMSIDPEVFEENSFNEIFLSKLGEYITKSILPDLYKERTVRTSVLPRRIQYFTALLSTLIIVGLLAPLVTLLLGLPVLVLIISYSFSCSLLFYLAIAFFQFLKSEVSE